ncbi:DEAD/DEAH box helicase family protein [Loktanella salsilacus]|uniref:DEAD/DEAH box helicase family protein n=1 Tax=Loktanella salsilacus TaxID=195913 RepID=UPI0030026278
MGMIGKIRRGSMFPVYIKLFDGAPLELNEKIALLSIAIECQKSSDEISQNLGYRIIAAYTKRFKDFDPLLQISANHGYAPLVDSIIKKLSVDDIDRLGALSIEMLDATMELYENDGIVLTDDQWGIRNFFEASDNKSVSIVAPTSFGKSELIVEFCRRNQKRNICILVPTKSLIAQTRKRILTSAKEARQVGADWSPEVVLHPEAFRRSENGSLCIYTQERLFRHFIMFGESVFDDLLVDEAHNMFGKGHREVLLNQILTLHRARAEAVGKISNTKFFTPFLVNPDSLSLRYQHREVEGRKITKSIKSEVFYIADLKENSDLSIYDHYFDKLHKISDLECDSTEDYIASSDAGKNIVYQNRPVKIELMARTLLRILPSVDGDEEISTAVKAIREYVHPQYLLGECIEKGMIYHHGSVPDIVKLYVESVFSEISAARFIICSSTLLEGVNIPATKLFLPTVNIGRGVLNTSQFNNLIGRVCRYKEIFKGGELDEELLLPEIHLIVNSDYMHNNINPKKFLSDRLKVDKKKVDNNENPLLSLDYEKLPAGSKEEADTFLDVIDPTVRKVDKVRSARTSVGYLSFTHNIYELDILEHERDIEIDVNEFGIIDDIDKFLLFVATIFISRVGDKSKYFDLLRLEHDGARAFYSMLMRWKLDHLPLAQMVDRFVSYWNDVGGTVFVGRWGDYQQQEDFFPRYVVWNEKTDAEKVNLAIVRIKDEQDFIESALSKYVDLVGDLKIIDPDLYLSLKYGTSDELEIELIKSGFNGLLAKHLLENYSEYVNFTSGEFSNFTFEDEILDVMRENDENEILIFEVKLMSGL